MRVQVVTTKRQHAQPRLVGPMARVAESEHGASRSTPQDFSANAQATLVITAKKVSTQKPSAWPRRAKKTDMGGKSRAVQGRPVLRCHRQTPEPGLCARAISRAMFRRIRCGRLPVVSRAHQKRVKTQVAAEMPTLLASTWRSVFDVGVRAGFSNRVRMKPMSRAASKRVRMWMAWGRLRNVGMVRCVRKVGRRTGLSVRVISLRFKRIVVGMNLPCAFRS